MRQQTQSVVVLGIRECIQGVRLHDKGHQAHITQEIRRSMWGRISNHFLIPHLGLFIQ
jgi:hypothetical protein